MPTSHFPTRRVRVTLQAPLYITLGLYLAPRLPVPRDGIFVSFSISRSFSTISKCNGGVTGWTTWCFPRIAPYRRRFAAALLPRLLGNRIPGHTTRAPPVGFELATDGIQFYAIANLDKTSLINWRQCRVTHFQSSTMSGQKSVEGH